MLVSRVSSVLEALRSPAESIDVRWLREQRTGTGGYVLGYVFRGSAESDLLDDFDGDTELLCMPGQLADGVLSEGGG